MTSTSELLLLADRQRPRSQQREIGVSDLGSCRRRTGYKLAGYEPVNEHGSIQAVIGSAVHDMIAAVLENGAAEPGDLVEEEVEFAGIIGHLDRYEARSETVVDVKTSSTRWIEHIRLHGPEHSHLWQVSVYAAALVKRGVPVKRIRIDYLVRDTGEEYQWPSPEGKPLDPNDVRDAMEWLQNVADAPVEMLPRDYEPDSVYCLGCPFGGPDGGICWEGHVPERDRRSVLLVEDEDAAKWAEELFAARRDKKLAEARAERAKGVLDGLRPDEGGRVQVGDYEIDFRRTAGDAEKWAIYFTGRAS